MSVRVKGILLVLAAALLWSSGGLGIKLVPAEALAISGFRALFALPVLLGFLQVRHGGALPALREGLRRPVLWGAAASYAVIVVCFVMANKLTTAANTILLQYTAPVWVALLSGPLLGEHVRLRDWLATAGCLGGMAWFFGEQLTPGGLTGNLIAIVAGVGFAGLTLLIRVNQRAWQLETGSTLAMDRHPVVAVVLGNVLALCIGLPWMLRTAELSPTAWAVLVALGTLQIACAYLCFTAGVARLNAVESNLVAMIEPILNPLWVALGTGETPSTNALAGGTLILLSVTLRSAWPRREPA
ncbi:MAG: DMT family transporter [Deltaproteobacteria bacterium]|nr:DMT family transporter [Deltaproteobacteria bacterium]